MEVINIVGYSEIRVEDVTKPLKKRGVTSFKRKGIEVDLEALTFTIGHEIINLEKRQGTKGGHFYAFLCPDCGRRCRKLYSYSSAWYACSKCQEVHKQTLNRTKTDCQYYWGLAIREARKLDPKFEPRKGYVNYGDFPKRPKWMKHHKYMKHWIRFNRYLDKGINLWLR